MRKLIIVPILCTLALTISSYGAEKVGETIRVFENVSPKSQFQLSLNTYFEKKKQVAPRGGEGSIPNLPGSKSVAKSVLFSAAVPGAGQFYAGSFIKGFAFAVVEAATLIGYVHYDNRGQDFEAEFEKFASANWEEPVYWDWMSEISVNPRSDFASEADWMTALRQYERANFSHTLPQDQNQQYFENISKYNQFNVGWVDTDTGNGRDSDLRSHYTSMRKDANDAFKRATNLATLTMLNHVVSAFDAGFTAKRKNRTLMKASVGVQGRLHGNQVIPALSLDVKW